MFGSPAMLEVVSIGLVSLGIALAFCLEIRLMRPKFHTARIGWDGGMIVRRLGPVAELAGRFLLGLLFIAEAVSKLSDIEGSLAYMQAFGLPAPLLAPAIFVELTGGLLILLGWQARIAALGLAGFCLATALLFHSDFGNRGQVIHFEKNLALAGAFLVLWANGAGRFSFDAWRRKRTG